MSWLSEFDAAQRQRTDNNNNNTTSASNDEDQKSSNQEKNATTSATSLHFNKQQNNNNKEDLVGEVILTYKDRTDRNNTKTNSDKLFEQFVSSNTKNTKNNDFDEDDVELEDEELRQMLDQRVLRRRQEIQLRGGKSSEHPAHLDENKKNDNNNSLKKSKSESENNGDEFGTLDDEEEEKLRHMQNLRMKLMASRQRDGLAKDKQQVLSSSSAEGNSKKNSNNAFFGDFDEDAPTTETKTTKQSLIGGKNVAKPKFNFSSLIVAASKKTDGNGNHTATSADSSNESSSSSILQKQRMFAQKKKFVHDQQEESLKSMEGFEKNQSLDQEEIENKGNSAENMNLTLNENKNNNSTKSATDDLMDSFLDEVLSSNTNKQIHQEDFGSWTSNKNDNQQSQPVSTVSPIVAAPVVAVNNTTGKKMSATQLALMMAKNQLKKD